MRVKGERGLVAVEGRAAGAMAWLRLSAAAGRTPGLPTAPRFAAFLNARQNPVDRRGRRLAGLGQRRLAESHRRPQASTRRPRAARALSDRGADALASEAANLGQKRDSVRWATVAGKRAPSTSPPAAGRRRSQHLDEDVTELEEAPEILKRNVEAHDETLNHIADAVAVFSQTKRLIFHNTAFAELWGLEPWLAERRTHSEILDRLRQRRRLPETVDYAKWKAAELNRYEQLAAGPDEMWSLPAGRAQGRAPAPPDSWAACCCSPTSPTSSTLPPSTTP